jgi:hypothetical protein
MNMEKISNSFKKLGTTTKILSILGIIFGSFLTIIGFVFKVLLKGVFDNTSNDVGMGGGILVIFIVFFLVLAALWYFGLAILIPSIIFLIVGIKLHEYSKYDIQTLKEKKNIVVLMTVPYVVCASLLIVFTIMWVMANGITGLLILIVPIVLLIIGMYVMFTNLRYINEYDNKNMI